MTTYVENETLAAAFRTVMAGVATPVTVVTAMEDGVPHGTTVSAFASLSLRPPMVLVALDRDSGLLARVRSTGRFGVNVLGSAQSDRATAFARKGGPDKFDGIPWETHGRLPRLTGASAWLVCEVAALVDGGDHVVAMGRVAEAETLGGEPLTYHARSFGTHVALERTS